MTVEAAAPAHAPGDPVDASLPPGATVGILGGGQLGRMLGLAARRLGYRLAVLDPDPDAPAMVLADERVVGGYGDVAAGLRLAASSDVVTYELEHVDARVVEAIGERVAVRPGTAALRASQDRIAERTFLAELGIPVAVWQAVASRSELETAVDRIGSPGRLKIARGGYDGRGQSRVGGPSAVATGWAELGHLGPLLYEREIDFALELSVVCARGADRSVAAFAPAENRHERGILVESLAPARVAPAVAEQAEGLATRIAEALGVVGTITVELFLDRAGSLLVNEIAPRVHNSGHHTLDACVSSQFEQHVRAICGLPLGAVALTGRAAATVNILGTGGPRPAHLEGVADALRDPDVRLHVYDKRTVFERRKMGHLTVVADDLEDALGRARAAAARLAWA